MVKVTQLSFSFFHFHSPDSLDQGYYIFAGSASTGSTKSATMELYTSSYNETMSGGGETLSSISEKSCISAGVGHVGGGGPGHNQTNGGGGGGGFPPQAYLMVGHYCI